MVDKEKVIKGLEICVVSDIPCDECPYDHECLDGHGKNLMIDALSLLKEQESTLTMLRNTMNDMVRGNASEEVTYLLSLLKCGQAVKWK